jgi:hypothetical protein
VNCFVRYADDTNVYVRSRKEGLDSGAKRNGLSEADFHVFAKLGENGLERGLETETFSRGQVCGEDDFLNLLVRELIDFELTRQLDGVTGRRGAEALRRGGHPPE